VSDGTQAVELLPCPFCGGEADAIELDMPLDPGYYVACRKCDGQMGDSQDLYRNRDVVAEMWNRRATPSPVGASVLWSDERIEIEAGKRMWTGLHASGKVALDIMKEIRDDYEAHRGASVPSEVMETIKESVNYAKKSVNELGKRSLTQREIDFAIARFDAALTWLAQQRGQG